MQSSTIYETCYPNVTDQSDVGIFLYSRTLKRQGEEWVMQKGWNNRFIGVTLGRLC